LVRWVAGEIGRDPGATAPTLAAHVLAARKAGAEGHAELLAALCRALDLPAQVVGGVLVQGGRIYGHAWVEVEVGDGMLAADPTFGQIPASSRLVRVAVGSGGRPIDLVPLLGSAKLEPIPSTR
jgi:transglutaminase-like putative cysteine protease